jgi:hypothetical protein
LAAPGQVRRERTDSLGVFPIEPAIICNIFHVAQFHGRPLCLDPLRKIPDCITIAKDGIDPLVLEAVR